MVQRKARLIIGKAVLQGFKFRGGIAGIQIGPPQRAARPVKIDAVDVELAFIQGRFQRGDSGNIALRIARHHAQSPEHPFHQRSPIGRRKAIDRGDQIVPIRQRQHRIGQLHNIPMDRLGLTAKGI